MLRAIVLGFGAAFVVAGGCIAAFQPPAWPAALEIAGFGVLVLAGTLLERRYRGSRGDGAGWQATSERFVDPSTGKLVDVRYNPNTGERAYVDAPTIEPK